jgi:hypothetical protein
MTFNFVHVFFTWLLPLAALPVIFHLFFRIKKRPRPFSSLMFFQRIDPRLSARRKIMEWLVLALRTLLILFLLLALARPVWFGAGRKGSAALVIILDNSGSMTGLAKGGQPKLQVATGAADALIASLKPEDAGALVLTVDDPAVPVPQGLTADKAGLRAAVARVKETEASGAAGNALARALALVDSSVATRYEIHVLTDLQETEWNKAATLKSPRTGTLVFVHRITSAPDKDANVSVLGANLPKRKILAGRRFALSIALANPTDSDAHGRLNWTDDGGNKGLAEVTVARRGENNALVVLEPQTPGLHYANLWYEGDSFTADNRLSLAFLCADKRPVLFLGKEDDFGLLPIALSPAAEGRLSGLVPVFAEPGVLAASLNEKRPALVVCAWESAGRAAAGDTLRSFVEAGGNLLVLPSANAVAAAAPPIDWLGATPARQEKTEQGAPMLAFKKESPIFADLRNEKGDVMLRNVKAFRFQPLQLAAQTTALFGLEDGRALLAEKRLGRGTVFISGLAFDPAWSTLPLKAGFLAVAQSMALAGGEAVDALLSVVAGDKPLALVHGNDLIQIQALAGSPLEWKGEPANLPVFPRSGVYMARTGTNVTYVSVRSADKESQRAFLTSDRIPALGALSATVKEFSDVETIAAQARKTQVAMELFLPLLLLALLCLALEGWLANPPPRKPQTQKTKPTALAAVLAAVAPSPKS